MFFSLMFPTPAAMLSSHLSPGISWAYCRRPLAYLSAVYRNKLPATGCGESTRYCFPISIIDFNHRFPESVPSARLPFLPHSLPAISLLTAAPLQRGPGGAVNHSPPSPDL
ncbi:hypothetical protein E2C01_026956 [Portunus trituberculatus]|uniref:Uncharacterized protein n=1 Tax=Portunus trituberculatus TaxID=210409 RepID=A0A5B7EGP0_PORTR|nr:hypothetical protein [Portunus trituberculatus]